jgi:hypothetical protein
MCQSDEGIIWYFERALTSVGQAPTSYIDYSGPGIKELTILVH